MNRVWVKICGVTREADAEDVVLAGADAIGLNFAAVSPRKVSVEQAVRVARAARAAAARRGAPTREVPSFEVVGVFVNAGPEAIRRAVRLVGLSRVQLHGDETNEFARSLGVPVYRAVAVASTADVALAEESYGDRVLVDTKVPGVYGGSGKTFDWSLAVGLAERRKVVLAGGLGPHNVAEAVQTVRPFGVDTASGVESAPGIKDPELVRQFVSAVRSTGKAG